MVYYLAFRDGHGWTIIIVLHQNSDSGSDRADAVVMDDTAEQGDETVIDRSGVVVARDGVVVTRDFASRRTVC